mgnify:CR=1 FL=1
MLQPPLPENDECPSTSLRSCAVLDLEYPVAEWCRQGRVPAEIRIGAGRYDDPIGDTASGLEVFFPYLRIVPRAKHAYWLGKPPFDEKRLDGLCDILQLFSTTRNNKQAEAVLRERNIKDWTSLLRPHLDTEETLLPFDEHDAGQSIAAKMETALDLHKTKETICNRLDYLAREHPALLMLPAVHCATSRILGMAETSTPHDRASAMLQVSHFLQARRIKLDQTQGRAAKSNVDTALSQLAAIDEAIEVLRSLGRSPVGQSHWTKETALRARVHAALTDRTDGKKMTIKEAESQMNTAMRYRRNPLRISKNKLRLAWGVPYSVPLTDHFACHPNVEELQWGLARWLNSQRFLEVKSLLKTWPNESFTMLDQASFFGGNRDGVKITNMFRALLKLTSEDGHPAPAAMIAAGLGVVAQRSLIPPPAQQMKVALVALAKEMDISEREATKLLRAIIQLQRSTVCGSISAMQRFMEVHSLPKGRQLPDKAK